MSDLAPIAVALDAPDLPTALAWAAAAGPYVSTVKVGLEVYLRDGAAAVHQAREASGGRDVFLDLKLHDIPNTVAGAARSVARLKPAYLTVHASGGRDMVRAAAEADTDVCIAAVPLRTSIDERALRVLGIDSSTNDVVLRLASVAVEAGARAIVCSP